MLYEPLRAAIEHFLEPKNGNRNFVVFNLVLLPVISLAALLGGSSWAFTWGLAAMLTATSPVWLYCLRRRPPR